VEAESGGGKIHLDDIGGSVSAETGGDSIEIGTVNGDLRLETGGGKIYIASAKGKVEASTGGGNIVLVSGAQEANLEAGGGNIDVKHCGGRLEVSTGGGNIELGDISGPVEIETGGGSIRLGWAKGVVRAQTGAGRIELNGVSSARAETGAEGFWRSSFPPAGSAATHCWKHRRGISWSTSRLMLRLRFAPASIWPTANKILSDFTDIRVTSEGGEWPGPRALRRRKVERRRSHAEGADNDRDIRFLRASR